MSYKAMTWLMKRFQQIENGLTLQKQHKIALNLQSKDNKGKKGKSKTCLKFEMALMF